MGVRVGKSGLNQLAKAGVLTLPYYFDSKFGRLIMIGEMIQMFENPRSLPVS
jgi:hypothetical protein